MRRMLILCITLACCSPVLFSHDDVHDIGVSVQALMESFTPEQRDRAILGFADTARVKWNNLPVGLRGRAGVSLGSLSDRQRQLVHRILSASLSSQGYLKATSIMHLDNLLNAYFDTLYQRREVDDTLYHYIRNLKFGHQNYYIALFGNPRVDSVWGYKLEGHHLSLNFTIRNQELAVTPMFVGSDPADIPFGDYAGWRVLGLEEDLGLKLMESLTPAQRRKATRSADVPSDIITGAESGRRLVEDWGIRGADLTGPQRETLQKIVREFVFNLDYDRALVEYGKIVKAGFENIYFGWIGDYDASKPHYYVLNGPTFLIEFDNNGGPRNAANHVHAIWREKGNEFGDDVLKRHYEADHREK